VLGALAIAFMMSFSLAFASPNTPSITIIPNIISPGGSVTIELQAAHPVGVNVPPGTHAKQIRMYDSIVAIAQGGPMPATAGKAWDLRDPVSGDFVGFELHDSAAAGSPDAVTGISDGIIIIQVVPAPIAVPPFPVIGFPAGSGGFGTGGPAYVILCDGDGDSVVDGHVPITLVQGVPFVSTGPWGANCRQFGPFEWDDTSAGGAPARTAGGVADNTLLQSIYVFAVIGEEGTPAQQNLFTASQTLPVRVTSAPEFMLPTVFASSIGFAMLMLKRRLVK
jgi:hypothetical protein